MLSTPFASLLPFVFALLWASSYIAAKVGLVDATPFALVGARLSIAAVAAALLITVTGRTWPGRKSWPFLLVGGALLHGFGLSLTHAALVAVDATPTALVHAFHPILTAALGTVLLRERFASWQWLGVGLGFVGVLLGVPLSLGSGNLVLLGLSLFGLTAGTLILKRFCADVPPFPSTAVQLIGGALASVLLMLFFETPHWRWTAPLRRGAGLEHLGHVDLRHGDLQPDARPPRCRPRLVGLLRRAGRVGADGLRAAERAPVDAGDRGARRLDRRRRAGVVAAGRAVSDGTFRTLLRYLADLACNDGG